MGFLFDVFGAGGDAVGVGAARDEAGEPVRVPGEQVQADRAAHGGTPEGGPVQAERVEHGDDIAGLAAGLVAVCVMRRVAFTVAARR